MAIEFVSGASTPASSTSTLSVPSSPVLKQDSYVFENFFKSHLFPASSYIEFLASRLSTTSGVFVYDLAEQVGFGTLTKSWSQSSQDTAPVVSLQTRSGAGLGLVGRLSQGTSKDKGSILTAYTTPAGLAAMAHSLSFVPFPTATSRLVIQVPTVTPVGDNYSLSPSLAQFNSTVNILPNNFSVVLSATAKESVDMAVISYQVNTHVIHLFDHHSASREIGHSFDNKFQLDSNAGLNVQDALRSAGYTPFDYFGDKEAHTVLVFLSGPLALRAKALTSKVSGLGVIVVRLLRPWSESAFLEALPASTKSVHVFDDVPSETFQGILHTDVLGSLLGTGPIIHAHRLVPRLTQEYLSSPSIFEDFVLGIAPSVTVISRKSSSAIKHLLFFSTPGTNLAGFPAVVQQSLLSSGALSSRQLTAHDVLSRPRGLTLDRIVLTQKGESDTVHSNNVDFLAVLDETLIKSHSILKHAKRDSPVLIVTPWTEEELLSNLPSETVRLVHDLGVQIYTFDAAGLAAELVGAPGPMQNTLQKALLYLVLLRFYLGNAAKEQVIEQIAQASALGEVLKEIGLAKINGRAWAGLAKITIPPLDETAHQEHHTALKDFDFNAIAVETQDGETILNGAKLVSWHDAAKHILFSNVFTPQDAMSNEEFPQNPALRPELPERTFLVTCTVNKRLTPMEYDRNVFHLEFDANGTGLKYEIGEALGIHGWNDGQEVLDFCSLYGVEPDKLITIPVPGVEGKVHTRTVFQALQQQVDLFGKPPKVFFTDLGEYATNKVDKLSLKFIGSAEGAATLKKLSEKDTVTFADVIRKYKSARPGIEVLCGLIGDIKPRHYSIASSQAVVGNRVDLLVVTVEWMTPDGALRFGQCTRYLAGLKIGQKVTVSIKPSVMKLPADPMQPLILAGLGTGAAPFRAFLQHRAWQMEQNIPVGPIYYYFGSRHQSQEYLYGEELEAYIQSGIITKAGLAFSRDGPKKVYIQHKMVEDGDILAKALHDEEGVFYLCGPTWPVPDVYNALVTALVRNNPAFNLTSAGDYLESLKEEERYVLEVY